jgi:hypothetical protein
MPVNIHNYQAIKSTLNAANATLVAVSKTKPVEDIKALYDEGQRDFGENYVQELADKEAVLPKDIHWHFIGHLQSNKVKYIAAFVHLIHGVDSESLLKEIDKQAAKNNRIIDCLLQVHIATEETKFGFDEQELLNLKTDSFQHLKIRGLMGMASFSDDTNLVRSEFKSLSSLFSKCQHTLHLQPSSFNLLSMGMSGDYKIAVEEGSNMVRIGSLLFGERNYNK